MNTIKKTPLLKRKSGGISQVPGCGGRGLLAGRMFWL